MATSIGKRKGNRSARSRSVVVDLKRSADSPAVPEKPEEERLDWDLWLEDPPVRPERTILARFEYGGRDKPMPMGGA